MSKSGMISFHIGAIIPQMWDDGARQVWDDDGPKVGPRSAQKSAAETGWMSSVETGQMSADETGQMSAAETGQMSAVETGQMSAVETRQMSKSQIGLPSGNGACPKPAQAQILADQSSGRGQKHQICSEMGRESMVWPQTKTK